MRLIKYCYLTVMVIALLSSCTDEPELEDFVVEIQNDTNEGLVVISFSEGSQVDRISLNPSDKGLDCSFTSENFKGYSLTLCNIDSLKFQFENSNKGYLSSVNFNTGFDFVEGPFGNSSKFEENPNNNFFFVINQDDFNNAFELPDQ